MRANGRLETKPTVARRSALPRRGICFRNDGSVVTGERGVCIEMAPARRRVAPDRRVGESNAFENTCTPMKPTLIEQLVRPSV